MTTKGFVSLQKINPEVDLKWHGIWSTGMKSDYITPLFYIVGDTVKGVVGEQTGSSYDDRSKES